jgi:23S rRNA maturation-related 3'-5' exoribonuclease YhaM
MKDFYVKVAATKRDQTITSFFVVVDKERRTRRDGRPYLAVLISDKAGQMQAKIWESADA